VTELTGYIEDEAVTVADFSRLRGAPPFLVFMPQWDLLDFLVEHGRRYGGFAFRKQADVEDVIIESGRVTGVRARTPAGPLEVRAELTIGADGRHSVVRKRAGFESREYGAPMDVLWFKLPRRPDDPEQVLGRFSRGHIMILLNRGDYWQCGFVIPKGGNDEIRARGLEAFRGEIAQAAPQVADRTSALRDWGQVKLLTVVVDRLRCWHRPGLLCIGDSAHAMSPVGGVGINLAIQDAVAAADVLVPAFRRGTVDERTLHAIQRRRMWPTRVTQRLQVALQNRVIPHALHSAAPVKMPWVLRQLQRHPRLRGIPARLVGVGVRSEHVGAELRVG
jgi:2-polyprenyl-6-methoxyphenol hydroxylase-like FAD-dependent oxidoreductase